MTKKDVKKIDKMTNKRCKKDKMNKRCKKR